MKKTYFRNKQAVSPVIATILMVAITVVLAATLYMMLPKSQDVSSTEPVSGRMKERTDKWLVEIDGGNLKYDSEEISFYNKTTGAVIDPANIEEESESNWDPTDGIQSFYFNDNDNNGDVNNGDTFVIEKDDAYDLKDHYKFRIEGTNLVLEFT